jgi:hypothetical protein
MDHQIENKQRLPIWLWSAAILGAAWNIFGLFQLSGVFTQTQSSLMMKGMSAEAAQVYYNLPLWMNLAFALGAGGGLLASIAMIFRRTIAVPVFWASLLGYITLFMGDFAYGLFDLIPTQLVILTTVVLIAVALLAVSIFAKRARLLV